MYVAIAQTFKPSVRRMKSTGKERSRIWNTQSH
nr:MAG TPA: hypothetical protein [Caudoviricetes sp.]